MHWASFNAFATSRDYHGLTGLGITCSRRQPRPSEGPSSWPSFHILPVQKVLEGGVGGHQRQASPTPLMHCERPLWLRADAPYPCPQKLLLLRGNDSCRMPARGHTATWATSPLMPSPRSTNAWPQTWRDCAHQVSLRNPLTIWENTPLLWVRGPRLLLWLRKVSFFCKENKVN